MNTEQAAAHDAVNHPTHYVSHPSGIECIEIVESLGFCLGNAVKYLFRCGKKGSALQDLSKSAWYVDREIVRRQAETWRAFPEDPRYEVSSAGRVRWAGSDTVRALVRIKSGYLTFATNRDGKAVTHYVHRAVARTFFGAIPKGMHVCHNDGDRENNHVTNLRIDTVRRNTRDRRAHGTHYYGEQNPAAKLDAEAVQDIRSRVGETEQELAAEFGVSRTTIGRVLRGESWADPRLDQQIAFDEWFRHEPPGDVREAIALIWRADLKGQALEDLWKARWYVEREIARRTEAERRAS